MPAFNNASTDQLNALRSSGWAGELRFAVCPSDVIFQCEVNQIITNASFTSFAWDNTLQGAYTDVVEGLTFFITATDDPTERRNPLSRGRVSQDPTATIFYCNETGINLLDTYIVTVISLFEILQKDRIGNLVDGWQTFKDLAPIVKNMQSFYYGESDTEFQFSFSPIGQAMAEGATITAYHWTIAGAIYTVGNANTRVITVTIPAGHIWAYLDITDSNGTSFRFIFEILVCLRDDTAFMFMAHDNVTINGTLENGWNVTSTFFAGVESLLNRTRCAIVVFDIPKAGALDLFNNVIFVGYFVSETTEVTADVQSSLLSQTSFELQSFTSIAGQLPVPSLAIRNVAIPTQWGEMKYPTTQRAVSYLLTRYSTLSNLCAMDMLYSDSTWFAGEMDLEEGTLLDSINRIGDEIQARLVFFPQGDATFEINANFLSDTARDALPTLLASGNIEPQDLFKYSLPIPYYKTVGQVIAGCATFYTSGATPVKLTAIAPKTARQEGNERPVVLAQLLESNLSQSDAITAAEQRIGDLLEYLNPSVTIPPTFTDGWHCLTPSTYTWITYDLPASDSTRGLPISPTQRYLLQSVSFVWNIENGSWDVTGTTRLETKGGLAQQGATISPNIVDTSRPVLPPLSDYDAFVPDASLNYQTTDPDTADLQPYTPNDMSQFTPMTTEDAANVADNTPESTCAIISPAVNFSSGTSRFTPVATTIGAIYTVTVKGRAQIGNTGTWTQTFNFVTSNGGWAVFDPSGSGFGVGTYVGSTGWRSAHSIPGGADNLNISKDFVSLLTVADIEVEMSYVLGANFTGAFSEVEGALYNGTMPVTSAAFSDTIGTYTETHILPGGTADKVVINANRAWDGTPQATVTSVTYSGTGTNPFTGAPAPVGAEYGDAFYHGVLGSEWVLYSGSKGLLVNGTPLAVPPALNENSEYMFVYTGDGNQTPFTYYDTDYSDNQNLALYIKVCGLNMGS